MMIRHGYRSITVANHDEIWLIRFMSKSYTHPWKSFTNKNRLVLHVCICFFWKIFNAFIQTRPEIEAAMAEAETRIASGVRSGDGGLQIRSKLPSCSASAWLHHLRNCVSELLFLSRLPPSFPTKLPNIDRVSNHARNSRAFRNKQTR